MHIGAMPGTLFQAIAQCRNGYLQGPKQTVVRSKFRDAMSLHLKMAKSRLKTLTEKIAWRNSGPEITRLRVGQPEFPDGYPASLFE